MKLTRQEREKIFCLYWGQKVLSDGVNIGYVAGDFENELFLELLSLSSITDEDAIVVGKIMSYYAECYSIVRRENEIHIISDEGVKIVLGTVKFGLVGKHQEDEFDEKYKIDMTYFEDEILQVIDFLRSKGYAIPAYGYTVNDLVEEGIFKIKIL